MSLLLSLSLLLEKYFLFLSFLYPILIRWAYYYIFINRQTASTYGYTGYTWKGLTNYLAINYLTLQLKKIYIQSTFYYIFVLQYILLIKK